MTCKKTQHEAGGRDPIAPSPTGERTTGPRGKFLDKKVGLKTRQFAVAHPDEAQEWVDQCGFVISWFREMWRRLESGDEKAAGGARVALGELLLLSVAELTALALDDNNRSAQWARELLAHTQVWIDKYCERLGEGYEDLRRELSVVFRNDPWEPESPLYQALHRELWLCQFYRREIPFPKAQRYLPEIQTKGVPGEYDSVLKLPSLSAESWKEWDEPLWLLVKVHNPGLRALLQERYERAEFRWSKYRKEFRQHLRKIAEAGS